MPLDAVRPLLLEPQFVPRIWGTQSLRPLFKNPDGNALIGEVWLSGNECSIVNVPFEGRKLAEAWREMSAAWAGTQRNAAKPFPLLAKFIFPAEKLSVQVHPPDDYVRQHEPAG